MDVFISYSSKDKKIADAICHCLEEDKIKCWIAPRDIQPGHDYSSELVKGIKTCKLFLLVFSSNSNNSKHVANEIEIATENEKLIIPFRIEDAELNDSMSYHLKRKHWIDAFPNPTEKFKKLSHQLNILLSKTNVQESDNLKPEPPKGPKKHVTDNPSKAFNQKYKRLIAISALAIIAMIVFYFVYPFNTSTDYLARVMLNNQYGFIDKEGREIISPQYSDAFSFNYGLAPVNFQNKWHYVDVNNEKVISHFEMATPFREEVATVRNSEGWFVIDTLGNRILATPYDFLGGFNQGLSTFRKNNKWGYLDITGNVIITNMYDLARPFSNGLAAVNKNGSWGLINKEGKVVVPFKYLDAKDFSSGLIPVKIQDYSWVLINIESQKILNDAFEDVRKATENAIVVKKNGSWGAIDKNGKEVIPFVYEKLGEFSNGFAAAMKNGKWGYIDKNNREIIDFIYEYADNFKKID